MNFMKIICSRQALVDAVNNVQRGVASKSALPALEGILMKASASSLFLAGYDMELGITTTIEATVEEPGELVLTAKLFSEIVRKAIFFMGGSPYIFYLTIFSPSWKNCQVVPSNILMPSAVFLTAWE